MYAVYSQLEYIFPTLWCCVSIKTAGCEATESGLCRSYCQLASMRNCGNRLQSSIAPNATGIIVLHQCSFRPRHLPVYLYLASYLSVLLLF
jgi:hypothetical protein